MSMAGRDKGDVFSFPLPMNTVLLCHKPEQTPQIVIIDVSDDR
jgi:hypothetical protein